MEEDNNDAVNVPKNDQPSASATVQAQATSLPTHDNTGHQPNGLPAGQAVQNPDPGEPLLSFGINADYNFTTFDDDNARLREVAPSPASGVGGPQHSADPSSTIPAPPPWQPLPGFEQAASMLPPLGVGAAAQDPHRPRTFAPPPVFGTGAGHQRSDPANYPPSRGPPAVPGIPQWQPTPVTTSGLLHAADASCTTTGQGNPRQLFGTGSGSAAQHPSQQSLLGGGAPS